MKKMIIGLLAGMFSLAAVANDSGAWYDPTQNGHGISMHEFMRDGESVRVFWWFAQDDNGEQVWFISSVEAGDEFVLYFSDMSLDQFPTGGDQEVSEVGVATLADLESGEKLFVWDVLSENLTCADLYGPVPPGPLDPRCRAYDEDGENYRFGGSIVLEEGLEMDEQGTSRFVRLTPAQ